MRSFLPGYARRIACAIVYPCTWSAHDRPQRGHSCWISCAASTHPFIIIISLSLSPSLRLSRVTPSSLSFRYRALLCDWFSVRIIRIITCFRALVMSKPGRLEDDLRELMSALKRNGADDWPGKPTQEPLKLDPTEVDPVAEDDPETEEGELPRDVRVVSLHHSSPVTNASADAERRALDTLMSEYVGAVAQARRADAEPPARTASDSAQEPPPPPQSMQELLDALDALPPLR